MAGTEKRAKPALNKCGSEADRLALRIQYGALGYRELADGEIEILLITSRRTKRWIIPKGWPIKGMKPGDSAAQEAFEEAGVRGKVSRRPIGRYIYAKRLKAGSKAVPFEIHVYALDIQKQERHWPECGQREMRWCRLLEAVALVDESQLSEIIADFVAHKIGIVTGARSPDKLSAGRNSARHQQYQNL